MKSAKNNSYFIWFDMDGTLADFYSVPNWLQALQNESVAPYRDAAPLFDKKLVKTLSKLQKRGIKIGVISYLSKDGSAAYMAAIQKAKKRWLKKNIAAFKFDAIHIVTHGIPKESFKKTPKDILFDDEEKNRKAWGATAYSPDKIIEILTNISRET